MYKTVQLMLPDTCAVAQGRLFKKNTRHKNGFGGSLAWCHTLECEMGSEVDKHSWPFTKHSSGSLATCLTCMPITPAPNNPIAVEMTQLSTGTKICH